MNNELVEHLDTIADYYIIANDIKRSTAFKSAARNVGLLSFEIDTSNLKDIKFQGLGESTLQEIKFFINGQPSERLDTLRVSYPPRSALAMLSLFNFDLEYVHHLWNTYQVSSIEGLFSVPDQRTQVALSVLQKVNTKIHVLPELQYHLLGDCIVHTAYGTGKKTVDELAEKLVELEDKHIFLADYLESPNVLSGVSPNRLVSQGQAIKKAQIDHNVRIFHGAIIDIDLDGKLIAASDIAKQVEFVALKIATQPHLRIISRLDKALTQCKKLGLQNIIIDCVNLYSGSCFQREGLIALLKKHNPILSLSGQDSLERSAVASFLSGLDLPRVSLASYAQDVDDLDNLTESAKIAAVLQLPKEAIINCLPHPFKIKASKNTVGVREKTYETSSDPRTMEMPTEDKLKETLDKIKELQGFGNSLGALLKGRKK